MSNLGAKLLLRLCKSMQPVSEPLYLALKKQRLRQQRIGRLWGTCLRNGWTFVYAFYDLIPNHVIEREWVGFSMLLLFMSSFNFKTCHLSSYTMQVDLGEISSSPTQFPTPHVFPSYTSAVVKWWNGLRMLQRRETPNPAICSDEQHWLQRAFINGHIDTLLPRLLAQNAE